MEDAPRLLRISKRECPCFYGCVFHDTNGPNHGQTLKIQLYFSNDFFYGHPLAGLLWKDNSRKFCWSLDGKKYRVGNVCLFTENKGCFCQWMCMTSKWLERSGIWLPCVKKKMKHVDIDEPTSFSWPCILGMDSAWMQNVMKHSLNSVDHTHLSVSTSVCLQSLFISASLVTVLSCALDHPTNAFALAQAVRAKVHTHKRAVTHA